MEANHLATDLQPPAIERASYPARDGNRVRVLVDGEAGLGAIGRRIRQARSSIWITVSFIDPEFRLPRGRMSILDELNAAAARNVDVRLLFWWSEFPGIGSFRGEPHELDEFMRRGIRIKMRWDQVPRGCHHQKSHIIDGEIAYVGGINLTSEGLSTPAHEEGGHHDMFAEIEGPVVTDVAQNFVQRWNQASRFVGKGHAYPSVFEADDVEPPDMPSRTGETVVQVVRTIRHGLYQGVGGWSDEHRFDLADGERSIEAAIHRWIDAAERLIYIENQYLMAPVTLARLCAATQRGVDVIAVVPVTPDPNLSLYPRDRLQETNASLAALADEERFGLFGLRRNGDVVGSIYVHAKLLIVDDRLMMIGSANLWPPSFARDSELNICVWGKACALDTRQRLWREHLGWSGGETLQDWILSSNAASNSSRVVRLAPRCYYVFGADTIAPWAEVTARD